jgi:hypothetical protein
VFANGIEDAGNKFLHIFGLCHEKTLTWCLQMALRTREISSFIFLDSTLKNTDLVFTNGIEDAGNKLLHIFGLCLGERY